MSIRPTSLAELQKMYSAFAPPKKAPKPRVLWALADFYSYLSEYLVVIYADTDTPYQEILTQIETISLEEESQLFKAYFDRPAGKFRRKLLDQPSLHPVPKEISRVHPVLRAVMLQIALGDQEIITFTQQFSDKFLNRAAARASMYRITKRAESIGQIMQDKFRSNLKQVLEESSSSGCLLPGYWLGVEYAVPSRRDERGAACGFHLHGQIVANKATLPDIKDHLINRCIS